MDLDARHKVRWLTDNIVFPSFQRQADVVVSLINSIPHMAMARRMLVMVIETLMRLTKVDDIGIDANDEFMRMVTMSAPAGAKTSRLDEARIREWETKLISANVIDEWHQDVTLFTAHRLLSGNTDMTVMPNYAMRRLIDRLNIYVSSGRSFIQLDTLSPEDRVTMKVSKLVTSMTLSAGPQPIRSATKEAWNDPDSYRGLVATIYASAGMFAKQFIEIERASGVKTIDSGMTQLSVARKVLERRAGMYVLNRHLDDAATFVHFISAQKEMSDVIRRMEIEVGQKFPVVTQTHDLGQNIRKWVLSLWPQTEWPDIGSIDPILAEASR